uniref:Uncharacterized protein n=1 Tax=Hyaloperonospora arabidopsidis (strain Emoy2) TaxID=559515 RepID=M4B851_HYAAE
MVKNPMRSAAKAAEKAAARVNGTARDNSQPRAADDTSSAAPSPQLSTPVAAGAPRAAADGFQVELIYSGESDGGFNSKKTPRSPKSPDGQSTILQARRLDQVARLMVTNRVCLVRRMSTLTHPPRLLLRVRQLASTTMDRTIVVATFVVPRLPLVPHRRL